MPGAPSSVLAPSSEALGSFFGPCGPHRTTSVSPHSLRGLLGVFEAVSSLHEQYAALGSTDLKQGPHPFGVDKGLSIYSFQTLVTRVSRFLSSSDT